MEYAGKVSFVIASRNRPAELATVVSRLLDTTPCPIMVVDNGSDHGAVDGIRQVAAQSAGRVTVLGLRSNLGAVGRNVGVAACRTPYIAFCDDDSWWTPESPALAADIFDRHPSVALVAARTEVWPQRRDDPVVEQLANSPLGRRPDLPGPSILGFLSCSAVVRKTAFEAAGGFSPILHFRGEEQLLAMDLAARGWDLCYCPELTAIHQPSALRATTAAQDARSLRNAVLTTWLRRPIGPCFGGAATLARAASNDTAHARAAAEALLRLPAVIASRRRLPAAVEHAVALLDGAKSHH
jgi:GT2 family glycosyltransferase